MAVRQRQEIGAGYHGFSSRLQTDLYNAVNDWAWEHRISLAKACSILITKAMAAEKGETYIPESEGEPHGK